MIGGLLKTILGSQMERALKKMWPVVDEINRFDEEFESLSDDQLRAKTWEFRGRLQDGETLDDLLPEAFAVVKQACRRHKGQRWTAANMPLEWNDVPFDVQLIGGIVLHQGKIAEMATGEGKTLVATLPLYLNALEGRGCHLVTTNDVLARRDSEWTGRILEWLGLTVGCIQQEMEPSIRLKQYACDVTYGQNSEFGFDYLRDNMAGSSNHLVQGSRSHVAQELADEIVAAATASEEGRTIMNRFRTLIVEAPRLRVLPLLKEFGGRFSLVEITVAWPEGTTISPLGDLSPRAPEVQQTTDSAVPDGAAQIRFQFQSRDHRFAIVDEVDSILIDEARTPLIISGQVDRSTHRYEKMKPLVADLVRKQGALAMRLVREAEELLEADDPDSKYRGGIKLLQVRKAMPKNKRCMKLVSEPEISRLVTRCENDFIIDQKSKMVEKSMSHVEEELFFVVDEKGHSVDLTEQGRAAVSPDNPDRFLLADIVDEFSQIEGNAALSPQEKEARKAAVRQENEIKSEELHNISQLLRAYTLFEKDVEYVVENNKVVIVDEFTGRPQPGRRYSDGLHQAIEAKESVKIEKESQTLATITIQNYFRMYDKLAGMTGTAETEASEFGHTYKMDVAVIPTNRPIARIDANDVIYRTRREKYNAIVEEIVRLHNLDLPILIGTVSVEVSELLSRMLKRTGISHSVLNAKYLQKEAEIVSAAGQPGSVTIATNMAGRGVDIKLGPGVIKCKDGKGHDGAHCPACPFKPDGARVDPEMEPCGLQIIGTERHEARRIDRQLRGRSGRQGDPGCSRFFLSLEDDLMRLFGSDRIAGVMQRLGLQEGESIEHKFITGAIGRAQRRIEEINFERRKRTLDYDNVMNKQRESLYGLRREVLVTDDMGQILLDVCYDALAARAEAYRNEGEAAETHPYDLAGFEGYISAMVPGIDLEGIERPEAPDEDYLGALVDRIRAAYAKRREVLGPDLTRELARYIALEAIDNEWRNQLHGIDELREGIHLRSYAQLDPLVEYQREATYMFQDMMGNIQRIVFEHFFRANVVAEPRSSAANVDYGRGAMEDVAPPADGAALGPGQPEGGDGRPAKPQTYHRDQPKVGRNDPCPCGSGKKFKKCCGRGT
ncbi:preprotein translocase subunit SecA [Candidatus Sumerlaeota bacterium]|nr:preprotein translocase subunit SecA [Candidatus Sumerlaeota bacterium]